MSHWAELKRFPSRTQITRHVCEEGWSAIAQWTGVPLSVVLDAGAEDLRSDGTNWEIISPPEVHDAVVQALEKAGIETVSAQIAMVPKSTVKLEGKNAGGMLRLAEALEEHDDVQNVYSNYEIDDKEMEALAS